MREELKAAAHRWLNRETAYKDSPLPQTEEYVDTARLAYYAAEQLTASLPAAIPDSVQASIDRLRANQYVDTGPIQIHWWSHEKQNDLVNVAESVVRGLIAPPAASDEGVAVDGSWLESVGFEHPNSSASQCWIVSNSHCELLFRGRDEEVCRAYINETIIKRMCTRGDVRRLCAALGITLKEQRHAD